MQEELNKSEPTAAVKMEDKKVEKKHKDNSYLIIGGIFFAILFTCCLMCVGLFALTKYGVDKAQEEFEKTQDELEQEKKDRDLADIWNQQNKKANEESNDLIDSLNEANNTIGFVSGEIGFPSSFIPEQTVCIESVDNPSSVKQCVKLGGSVSGETTFSFGMVPGSYYVYAQVEDNSYDPDYKAYYSEFVTCGMSVECESHDPVEVKVQAGEKISDIMPIDWYSTP